MNSFDVVVVGGGMVGAASALSLAHLGLKIAVIEKSEPQLFDSSMPYDLRVSAISAASEHLLTRLGAWQHIQKDRNCKYKRLGVWEEQTSYTEFNADIISQPHLGHIIENNAVQSGLWQEIQKDSRISCYTSCSITDLKPIADGSIISTDKGQLQAKLIVAADGARSQIRGLAGIGVSGWQYKQSAMLIHVKTELEQQDITWQQFTPTGPVAMLPLEGKQASLVWYHTKDEIKRLSGLSNEQLTSEVMAFFPSKLGQVEVINKAAFPLARQHANQYVKHNVVLLGDAAHTINPLAGQGVNLGFKDVDALQMVLAEAIGEGHSWYSPSVLNAYEKKRRFDNGAMMTAMDAFYFTFTHPNPLIKFARNTGLYLAERAGPLKQKALAYACGLS